MASLEDRFVAIPGWGKALVLVGLLVLLGVGYYALVYSSISGDVKRARQTQTQLKDQIRDAERREKQYLELTQELANREVADRQNRRILPENAEIAAFLQDLNRVAELSGLTIRLVEPRPEQREELYAKIPVVLALTGRFHQMGKFFYNVSKLDRAISLENIRMTQPKLMPSGEVLIDVDVRATTYRRPPAEGKK
ncbi:MAG: type 4a pilus biogenesis protein PilO [Deltaproteobacteria bacterium]|nr:type 4a pilus biogenesis protein PilO [Deltaproteobacteria bacterium]NND30095.1 type 4a pilus biogenesis protein PilO [Myxococcales bacterium]MBT8465067.1 type 4a pilus biogenesis protein PilO [Deltaproteobacteria bacterium]MBT8481967.1 type 4a pilus biogenesis protein PilO [Deltaproteobacteria bacterium]NNK08855.1 type 4a pilus biogenesis protein PilO [Myxococcales bacterium]